jgi:hypothetical protein
MSSVKLCDYNVNIIIGRFSRGIIRFLMQCNLGLAQGLHIQVRSRASDRDFGKEIAAAGPLTFTSKILVPLAPPR